MAHDSRLRLVLALVATAVLVATISTGTRGRTGEPPSPRWTILGPGGGGTTKRPAISPHDAHIVLVACDMTGAYVTVNGGDSWRMFNLGTDVSSFGFDPSDADVMYAGTTALWRSTDRGRTWAMAFPDPSLGTRTLLLGDHADAVIDTADPLYPKARGRVRIQAIAVAGDRRVFIAVSGGRDGGAAAAGRLLTSRDARRWEVVRSLPPDAVLAMTLSADGRIAIVTERRVLVQSRDGWNDHSTPDAMRLHAAAVSFAADGRVVLTAAATPDDQTRRGDRLFRSEDGGTRWSDVQTGPLAPSDDGHPWRFRALAGSASHPDVVFVGFEARERYGASASGPSGVARTIDGGRTWSLVLSEGPRPSPVMNGSWVEARAVQPGPDVWFDPPYDMAVSPVNPDVVYVTDLFRTYRTTDGGRRWQQVNSRPVGNDAWTSTGLDVTTNYGLDADPFDARRLLLSNTDMGLFRSEDGGASWIPSSEGVPQEWRNTTYAIAFDPAERGLAYGAFSGTHDLPRPKMWRQRDPARYRGGVGISRDGGRTWTPAAGLPPGAATHVWIDPASPAGKRTVYVTLFGRGVFKSTDGGQSWAPKNEGIAGTQPFAWRLVPAPPHRLYLIVSRRSEDGRIGDDQDGAVYASDDGSETWTPVTLPEGTNGPAGLLVDPEDPTRLYLAAWGRAGRDVDTGGGVFLSTDGGATWRQVFREGQHVYDITRDPRTGTLYVCGFDQGAWRSTDRAATWQRIEGYTFKWGHRVIPDPSSAGDVYITTFGGGLWHGPGR